MHSVSVAATSTPCTRRASLVVSRRRMFTVLPISRWKCAGSAQLALEPGAGDLERVVTGHRIVVVELAGDEPGGQGDVLEVDAALAAGRGVDGDPQRAAAELEVVEVELEVGDDGRDERTDALHGAVVAHRHLLDRSVSNRFPGLSEKKAWTLWAHAFGSDELQRRLKHSGRPVRFGPALPWVRRRVPTSLNRSEVSRAPNVDVVPAHAARGPRRCRGGRATACWSAAGYIRRAAPGGFTWLPLGWIVYRNVERIVREEMDREGFQEVHFPALLPREPYEASGRWTDYGDNLFRLKDRRGADMLLAPTHEEMFTLLVKDLYSSYKDLPLVIYQIQNKFRDEARPRAGLLRGREFTMKDSYSFDIDDAGLDASYAEAPRRPTSARSTGWACPTSSSRP